MTRVTLPVKVRTKLVKVAKSKVTFPVFVVSVEVAPTTAFEKVVTPVDAIVMASTSEAEPIVFPSPIIISSVKVAIPVIAAVPLISTLPLISIRVELSSISSSAFISKSPSAGEPILIAESLNCITDAAFKSNPVSCT